MADQELQLKVGIDAKGSGCWEVVIDGVLHQNRSQAPLRKLIEQCRVRRPHNPLARWAHLEPIEVSDEELAAWAGDVREELISED